MAELNNSQTGSSNAVPGPSSAVSDTNKQIPSFMRRLFPQITTSASSAASSPGSSSTQTRLPPNEQTTRPRLKRLYSGFVKKTNRRPLWETSSDNSSSDEEDVVKKRIYSTVATTTGTSTSSTRSAWGGNEQAPTTTASESEPQQILSVMKDRMKLLHALRRYVPLYHW